MKFNKVKEKFAREFVKDIYKKEHGNNKPDFWVCGDKGISTSDETKCSECKKVIYYDRESVNFFSKKVKKICVNCALKLDITEMERELLTL